MARALGMRKIIVSRFSGVLSAYGISAADVVCEKQEACATEYGDGEEDPPEVKLSRSCYYHSTLLFVFPDVLGARTVYLPGLRMYAVEWSFC